ncbi:hypothetical protein BN946_scf184801.g2 [Trametes cinnabarina]|uniref:HNH nuclease domain-containing protein n=1 Tax=Pycnoporus cinnabarinus TaxID=5643 RepID=A0A060S9D5_PYCCI|nr:hypothetical protein BN946_scf184801.g2 [Trametes cinnabarina]
MTALPSANEANRILPRDAPNAISLYTTLILPAERLAVERLEAAGDKATTDLKALVVYARVVGYLLLFPPSDIARDALLGEVASCNDSSKPDPFEALYGLGKSYVSHIISLFKSARGKTPTPESHPSRPSFDRLQADHLQELQPSPRDHSSAKKSALVRDNFRCMVSGKVDDNSERAGLTQRLPNEMITVTQCCHIFPDALEAVSPARHGDKEQAVSSVWTFLDRFGFQDVCKELMGATAGFNPHHLENILTLEINAHVLFDRLDLWFEAVEGQPNMYHVGITSKRTHADFGWPQMVHFISHHQGLPLPNPSLS